jgi:hypothetical protein
MNCRQDINSYNSASDLALSEQRQASGFRIIQCSVTSQYPCYVSEDGPCTSSPFQFCETSMKA